MIFELIKLVIKCIKDVRRCLPYREPDPFDSVYDFSKSRELFLKSIKKDKK